MNKYDKDTLDQVFMSIVFIHRHIGPSFNVNCLYIQQRCQPSLSLMLLVIAGRDFINIFIDR